MELLIIAAGAAGYLLGSISFAVIVARAHGVDIFKVGSGNPGATNVKRACGRGAGNRVFVLDVLKGLAAAGWPAVFYYSDAGGFQPQEILYAQLAGFAGAVLGHCFSVFLRFRGGKGVAVSVGGLLGTMPPCLFVAGALWLVIYFLKRIVSIASILAGVSLPVTAWFLARHAGDSPQSDPCLYLAGAIAVFIIFTHRSNIARLFSGNENTFSTPEKK